jgi:hypothetical protein
MERKAYIAPDWCKDICQNSGNVACEYYCARKREAEYFLPNNKPMPKFPLGQWKYDMGPQERQVVVGYYMTKIVEHITGAKDESLDAKWDGLTDGQLFEMITEQGLIADMFEVQENED